MPDPAKPEDKKADDKPKTIKATISPHRTLVVNGEHRAAGDEVEVAEAEYRTLVAQGFLVNPDAPGPTVSTGPKIQRTGS